MQTPGLKSRVKVSYVAQAPLPVTGHDWSWTAGALACDARVAQPPSAVLFTWNRLSIL